MADRFDKFTERARRVLTLAQEEAHRLNLTTIGPEQILLGIVRERDGVASVILRNLVPLETIKPMVEGKITKGEKAVFGELTLTEMGRKVIELSVEQAKSFNHHYIGTEHLLLGLLALPEPNLAGEVLSECGITLEQVRNETVRIITKSMPQVKPNPPLTEEEKAKIEEAKKATLESLARFNLTSDPEIGFQAEISARGLGSLVEMRFLGHRRHAKQSVLNLIVELHNMVEHSTWDLPTLPEKEGKAWMSHVVWEIWLPVIKEILKITPEDVLLAESEFSEAVAKFK